MLYQKVPANYSNFDKPFRMYLLPTGIAGNLIALLDCGTRNLPTTSSRHRIGTEKCVEYIAPEMHD